MRTAAPSDPPAAVWGAAILSAPAAGPAATMPEDRDWEAYKVPPTRTPVSERITSVPNPVTIFQTVFNYVIDAPVTFVRGTGGSAPLGSAGAGVGHGAGTRARGDGTG